LPPPSDLIARLTSSFCRRCAKIFFRRPPTRRSQRRDEFLHGDPPTHTLRSNREDDVFIIQMASADGEHPHLHRRLSFRQLDELLYYHMPAYGCGPRCNPAAYLAYHPAMLITFTCLACTRTRNIFFILPFLS
jgi:hypothetical protein